MMFIAMIPTMASTACFLSSPLSCSHNVSPTIIRDQRYTNSPIRTKNMEFPLIVSSTDAICSSINFSYITSISEVIKNRGCIRCFLPFLNLTSFISTVLIKANIPHTLSETDSLKFFYK